MADPKPKTGGSAPPHAADKGSTLDDLERRTYQIIAFGFPLLTLVIITGSVWAQFAWGKYWQWDPKETASLVAWLIYAAYLHGRTSRGWRGSTSAAFAVIGFLAVLFCFAGVNMLPGMHSYGRPAMGLAGLGGWEGMGPAEMMLTKAYLFVYVAALIAYVGAAVTKDKLLGRAATALTVAGLLAQTGAIATRTVQAGRLPFTSGYDFAICFVWGIVLCYLVLEFIIKTRSIGAVAMAVALLVNMYAYLWFPQKGVQPLPPALQNRFWLHIHVALAIITYGALALSCASGVMYFVVAWIEKPKRASA
jgi:ABC-type transport system involved in cytochrome c biogenesis permease subunit